MFCDEITVGTGVTEYSYSDRHPYEVVKVENQKRVYIRPMKHKSAGEAYSNNWELSSDENAEIILVVKRGDYWYSESTLTLSEYNEMDFHGKLNARLAGFSEETLKAKGKQTKRSKMNLSFGICEYYYDYEF